jgi:hypothetical protein
MGASSGIKAGEQPSAETLLDAFKTIGDADRARHASVLEYWLSIRGNRELPPLRDLDPLEISDAGPDSVLLELIGGGEDATIRYIGAVLKPAAEVEHIAEAPRSSILASIAKKLSIVAISRNFLAFEDEFANAGATTRCWVTLLPLSSAGAWVDYVYAFVTFDADAAQTVVEPEVASDEPVVDSDVLELAAEDEVAAEPEAEAFELTETADAQPVEPVEAELPAAEVPSSEVEAPPVEPADPKSPIAAPTAKSAGFSFDAVAASGGFYATKAVKVGPRPVPSAPDTAESFEEAPAATVDQQESASGHQQQTIPAPTNRPLIPSRKSRRRLPSLRTKRDRRPSNNPSPVKHRREPCRTNSKTFASRLTRLARPSCAPTLRSMKGSARHTILRSTPSRAPRNISECARRRG